MLTDEQIANATPAQIRAELVSIRPTIDQWIADGNQGRAYSELYRLTGAQGFGLTAQVTTGSGFIGGIAYDANMDLAEEMGPRYPGIGFISNAVAVNEIADYYALLMDSTGVPDWGFKDSIDSAQDTWSDLKIPRAYPATMLAAQNPLDFLSNAFTSGNGVSVRTVKSGEWYTYGGSLPDYEGDPGNWLILNSTARNGSTITTVTNVHTGIVDHVTINGVPESAFFPDVEQMLPAYILLKSGGNPMVAAYLADAANEIRAAALPGRLSTSASNLSRARFGTPPRFRRRLSEAGSEEYIQLANLDLTSGRSFFDPYAGYLSALNTNASGSQFLILFGALNSNGDDETSGRPFLSAQRLGSPAVTTIKETVTHDAQGAITSRETTVETKGGGSSSVSYGSLGAAFGSSLSRMLKIEDKYEGALVGSLLGAVGLNIGQELDAGRGLKTKAGLAKGFEDFDLDLAAAGLGAIGSLLLGGLIAELGIEGLPAQVLQSAGGAAIGQIAHNIVHTGLSSWSNGLSSAGLYLNALGSFAGSYLASQLVQFHTLEGQLGAALGSAVGGIVGGAKLGAVLGGPLGAAVGAFVGYLVGGVIGTWLSGGPAKSWATVSWDEGQDSFEVTNVQSKRGGSEKTARVLANNVANSLNGVIQAAGGKLANGHEVFGGVYGGRGSELVYWPASPMLKGSSATEIVNHGTYIALLDVIERLMGGDVFAKRAILSNLRLNGLGEDFNVRGVEGKFSIESLLGDLVIASDYSDFVRNAAVITTMLAADPDGNFAAPWVVTLARGAELGLGQRAFTDWTGGFSAFFDEGSDNLLDGHGASPLSLDFVLDEFGERNFLIFDENNIFQGVVGDTIFAVDKDRLSGTSMGETIIIDSTSMITATWGGLLNGIAWAGSAYEVETAAIIDAGDGNDIVYAGNLGNDVLGGSGNDLLVGGKLDDWLFGEAGNDVLRSSDPAAHNPAAYLQNGSNGDYLDGGAGNDLLYGDAGSQWLAGGEGDDAIWAGGGGDILDGGTGTDIAYGQEGSDQYLFGYGDGVDYVYDDSDPAHTAATGPTTDAVAERLTALELGSVVANWLGNSVDQAAGGNLANGASGGVMPSWANAGAYEVNGDVRGGEDAIVFKTGVTMGDLFLQQSGDDLSIQLFARDANDEQYLTGDTLIVQNWFASSLTRVEWLRFADGEEVRIGDAMNIITGTNGPDTLIGTSGTDFIYGLDGDDELYGLAGNDLLNAGRGNDMASGGADNDWVLGGLGEDKVFGDSGNDFAFGDNGNDFVYGGAGHDRITGGKGDDVIVTGAGDDIVVYRRGDGQDSIIDETQDWEAVWIDGAYVNGYALQYDGTVSGQIDSSPWASDRFTYYDGQKWIGDYYYNRLEKTYYRYVGDAVRFDESEVSGVRRGTSVINAGNDTIQFGTGIDIQDLMLTRSGGSDYLWAISEENSVASFDSVEDKILIRNAPGVPSSIENFVFTATGRINLQTVQLVPWLQTENADYINTIFGNTPAWVTGLAGDDTILTGGGVDFIVGGAGSDKIEAGAGDDKIWGGAGDDLIDGGAGTDIIMGGGGFDTVSYKSFQAGVTVNLSTGATEGDQLFGIENIEGSWYADTLTGDAGNNVISGIAGADILQGGAGDDTYEWGTYSTYTINDSSGSADYIELAGGYYLSQVTASGGEAARTNIVTYSEAIDNAAWTKSGVSVAANAATAPTGASSAEKLAEGAAAGSHILSQNVTLTANTVYTATVYVKAAGRSQATFTLGDGSGANTVFASIDLTNGAITARGGTGAGALTRAYVLSAANGYFRVVLTGKVDTSTTAGKLSLQLLDGAGAGSYTGDGSSGMYVWGSQLEAGDTPTSYIAVAGGTAVARSASDLTLSVGGYAAITVQNQAGAGQIESLQFNDGLTGNLASLRQGDSATTGDDLILGGAQAEVFDGAAGNDVISGGGGNDTLIGGAGDDLLEGGAGADILNGGPDSVTESAAPVGSGNYGDTARFTASTAAVNVNLATLSLSGGDATGDSFTTYQSQNGVLQSQTLNDAAWSQSGVTVRENGAVAPDGSTTADLLIEDTTTSLKLLRQNNIAVAAGSQNTASVYVKAAGKTTGEVWFWSGSNFIGGRFDLMAGTITGLQTGSGAISGATISAATNGYYRITVTGTIDSSSTSAALDLRLDVSSHAGDGSSGLAYWGAQVNPGSQATAYVPTTSSAVSTQTFATIENLSGSDNYGDTLTGDARANRVWGGGGDDTLGGGAGADVLDGGAGADLLHGDAGDDALSGGLGADALYGDLGKDLIDGGEGADVLYGDVDATSAGGGDDQLVGGAGNDTLYGGSGKDALGGGDGADLLYGNDGADQISGGAGNDSFYGGDGDDILSGDAGDDVLRGESGDDTFVFGGADGWDTVSDAVGANKVQFSDISNEQVWLTRAGNDLRIGVIGGGSTVVLKDYYASSNKTLVKSIQAGGYILFLKYAQPLIDAMSSATVPSEMPQGVKDLLGSYWHLGDKAAPSTDAERSFVTDEDQDLDDQLVAVDHDENIPLTGAYTIAAQGTLGTVTITDTGEYTYTPDADVTGQDEFTVKVTDADGQSALQHVTVTIAPVNDAPRNIVFTPISNAAIERDHPSLTQTLPTQVLGLLSATDSDGPASNLVALNYTVSDSRFEIVDTGQGPALALKAGQALDFEANPTVTISVTATDSSFNRLLNSEDLTAWSNTSYPATITADQGAGPDGEDHLDRVLAPSNGGASGLARHAAFQNVAGAVAGSTYTVSFYARADGASKYLWVGDTGDVQSGQTLWNTASFDLSGAGSVRAQNANVSASIESHGGGLYRVSVTFTRASSGNFQIVAGPDRATSTIVNKPTDYNFVDGWTGAGESVLVGYGQLETGASKSSYAKSTAAPGATAVTDTVTVTVIDQDDLLYGDNQANALVGQANRDIIRGANGNDQIFGLAGDDDLYGDIGDDSLYGGLGADTLYGGVGKDLLDGGAGNDLLDGGDADDRLFGGEGDDSLIGGVGDDNLSGGFGVDTLDGGLGSDFASYADSGTSGLTVSLLTPSSNTGMAAADAFVSIENLRLSDGDDVGVGDANDNILIGAKGNDTLTGNGGVDTVYGGEGADTINAGDGADVLYGDDEGGAGFNDSLNGGADDDTIFGYGGDDVIHGDAGSDMLNGGDGADTIYGDAGNDRIWGGAGNDDLRGGEGSDTYIIDTASGQDTLTEVDATGDDVDVLGYQDGIGRDYLWFEKVGNDLTITVVGTTVTTTIKDWYSTQTAPSNVKLEYIAAGNKVTQSIDAQSLVTLMTGFTKPITKGDYDTLHANSSFQTSWLTLWGGNAAPAITTITSQTVAEDGVITVNYTVSDDISNASIVMSATSSDARIIDLIQPGANGQGSFKIRPLGDFSGVTAVTLTATDPGGLSAQTQFNVTVTPVVDPALLGPLPDLVGTLDGDGSMPLVLPAALTDSDGSETLQIRISGLPTIIKATDLSGGTRLDYTNFLDGNFFISGVSTGSPFETISYDFGSTKWVSSLQLDGAKWTGGAGGATLKAYGSTDNVNWTELTTFQLSGAGLQSSSAQAVSNNYRYLKLTASAFSSPGQLWLDRLQISGHDPWSEASLQTAGNLSTPYVNTNTPSNAQALDSVTFASAPSTGGTFDALKYDFGGAKTLTSLEMGGVRWADSASGSATVTAYGSLDNTNWTSLGSYNLSGGAAQTKGSAISGSYRYVKLSPTSYSSAGQLVLDQLRIDGYVPATPAALQGAATATSSYGSYSSSYLPSNAKVLDGSYYISPYSAGYAFEAVRYDLGAQKQLSSFNLDNIFWNDGNQGSAGLTIHGSTDGVTWANLSTLSLSGIVLQNKSGTLSGSYRYINVAATSFGTNGNIWIDRFQVNGVDVPTPAPLQSGAIASAPPFVTATSAANAQAADGVYFISDVSSTGFDALRADVGSANFVTSVQLGGIKWSGGNGSATLGVYGSADGANWTMLSSHNLSGSAYQDLPRIAVSGSYRYIKLSPTSVSGSGQLYVDRMQVSGRSILADLLPGASVTTFAGTNAPANAQALDSVNFSSVPSNGSAFDALKYDFGAAKSLTSLEMDGVRWADGASGSATVTAYGSLDNSNWTSLGSYTLSGASAQTKSSTISGSYRYVKLSPTSYSTAGHLILDRLQVTGYVPGSTGPLQGGATATSGYGSYSSSYPVGNAKVLDGSYYISTISQGYAFEAVQYDFGVQKALTSYSLDNVYWSDANQGIAGLTIYGSNDGSTWSSLSTQSLSGLNVQTKTGSLSGSYRYIKVSATSFGTNGALWIDRFQISGTDVPAPAPLQSSAVASAPPFVAATSASNAQAVDGSYFISDVSSAAFDALKFDIGSVRSISSVELDGIKWNDAAQTGVASVHLLGSVDNINWISFDDIALTGLTFSHPGAATTSGSYRYFKLQVSDVGGPGQLMIDSVRVRGPELSDETLQGSSAFGFNHGSFDPVSGAWILGQADLADLQLQGPANAADDFTLEVTATSTDPGATPSTSTTTQHWNIALNAAPELVSTSSGLSVSFAEKSSGAQAWAEGARIADLSVIDPDGAGDATNFVLTDDGGGRFKAAFNTTTQKWELQVKNGLLLDYEDGPNRAVPITVKATDSGGLTKTQVVTVNLTNINDSPPTAPTEQALTSSAYNRLFMVYEAPSYAGYERVTALAATDADGSAVSYQIVPGSDPWGLFSIVGNEVRWAPTSFNFDSYAAANPLPANVSIGDMNSDGLRDIQYNLQVRATDGVFNSNVLTVPFYIQDVNEAPTFGSSSYSFFVPPSATASPYTPYTIGSVGVATDPDWDPNNRNVVASLSGTGAGSYFGFNAATGQISYLSAAPAGYYNLVARARDHNGTGQYSDVNVTIAVPGAPAVSAQITSAEYYNPYSPVDYLNNSTLTFTGSDPLGTSNIHWYVDSTSISYDTSGGMYTPPSAGFWTDGLSASLLIKQWGYFDASLGNALFQYSIGYDLQLTAYNDYGQGTTRIYRVYDASGYFVAPIILNLDEAADGAVTTVVPFAASAESDVGSMTWMQSHQGFLALDRNGNGLIDDGSEISFTQDLQGAKSDLEGLTHYDTNQDSVFDAQDERFGQFRVWRDFDLDGVTDDGELLSLAEAGVLSIDLKGQPTGNDPEQAQSLLVHATTSFTRLDGTTGTALDAMLIYRAPVQADLLAEFERDETVEERDAKDAAVAAETDETLDGSAAAIRITLGDHGSAPTDGLLVYDRNGNGVADGPTELSFLASGSAAKSGLEGLAAFDTNHDGKFDGQDGLFKYLGVWRDEDGDGVSDIGEIVSLSEAGLQAFNLQSVVQGSDATPPAQQAVEIVKIGGGRVSAGNADLADITPAKNVTPQAEGETPSAGAGPASVPGDGAVATTSPGGADQPPATSMVIGQTPDTAPDRISTTGEATPPVTTAPPTASVSTTPSAPAASPIVELSQALKDKIAQPAPAPTPTATVTITAEQSTPSPAGGAQGSAATSSPSAGASTAQVPPTPGPAALPSSSPLSQGATTVSPEDPTSVTGSVPDEAAPDEPQSEAEAMIQTAFSDLMALGVSVSAASSAINSAIEVLQNCGVAAGDLAIQRAMLGLSDAEVVPPEAEAKLRTMVDGLIEVSRVKPTLGSEETGQAENPASAILQSAFDHLTSAGVFMTTASAALDSITAELQGAAKDKAGLAIRSAMAKIREAGEIPADAEATITSAVNGLVGLQTAALKEAHKDQLAQQQKEALKQSLDEWRQAALEAMRNPEAAQNLVSQPPTHSEAGSADLSAPPKAPAQTAPSSNEDLYVAMARQEVSALDAGLSTAERTRILMVQAIAGFSAGAPGMIDERLAGMDAQAQKLLTALPDLRIG